LESLALFSRQKTIEGGGRSKWDIVRKCDVDE
jgi:hypothetical protein